jgi:signal transduction histidine kinase
MPSDGTRTGVKAFHRISFRVPAALLIIIIFFLVSNGGALVAIFCFQARFSEIAGIRLEGLIAASDFSKSSERIAVNAPGLAAATTQTMRETALDQIDDQIALLDSSLERVRIAGVTPERFYILQSARDNTVNLLKNLDQQVREQVDLDSRLKVLLGQLRNDARQIDTNPILDEGMPNVLSRIRTAERADVPRWTAPANEAVAVMLAVASSNDEFQLERLRESFLGLWHEMESDLPTDQSSALIDLRADIRHLGVESGNIFDLRAAQIRIRTAIRGALSTNKLTSSRLLSAAAEMFEAFSDNIEKEDAFLRRMMYNYIIFSIFVGIFCTCVAVRLFVYVNHGVVRRLSSLQECMKARVESVPVAIPTSGHDEIAEMARATAHFITTIERREESLNRIFEAAPIPITLVRMTDGCILRANGRAIRQFGSTLTTDCGASNLYRNALMHSNFLEQLARRGFVDGHEARLANASSKLIHALFAGQLIESDGELCGLVGVTDISLLKEAEDAERIAKERAEEAIVAKSRFLMNVSHELRTPLNAIIGLTEVLCDGASHFGTEKALEPLGRVVKAGRHLLKLINQILDIAKIDAGKMSFAVEEVDVVSVIDEVVSIVALTAEQNGNRMSVRHAPDVSTLFTDRMMLCQILLNLLSNAARFTIDGDILLSVDRERADQSDWITFHVADTGVGISEEHIGRLFEEFGQAGPSTSRQYGGTGLGLAITDRLCRLMGGTIMVQSKLGSGSTFAIRLPIVVGRAILPESRAVQR